MKDKTKDKTKEEMIKAIFSKFDSIMKTIELNVINYIGLGYLLENPNILNLAELKDKLIPLPGENFQVDTFQALGLVFLSQDRPGRIHEIKAAAKRTLLADAPEIVVDSIYRMHKIFQTGKDPYSSNDTFSVQFDYLYSGNKKAAPFFTNVEKKFIKDLLRPVRDSIRHNNSTLIPKKEIVFNEILFDIELKVQICRDTNNGGNMHLTFLQCWNIYKICRELGVKFYKKLESQNFSK